MKGQGVEVSSVKVEVVTSDMVVLVLVLAEIRNKWADGVELMEHRSNKTMNCQEAVRPRTEQKYLLFVLH